MIVVTTPTGQIGRHVLADLVAAGEPVRAIARDRNRIAPEVRDRVEVVEGSHDDPATVVAALDGAEAVFYCIPPGPSSRDARGYYQDFARPLVAALPGSSVRRVVFVSSGGRGRSQEAGPIGAAHLVEELLEATGVDLRSLRCGYFMENLLHLVGPLRHQGRFFYPMRGDVAIPICAARDIGVRAAALLGDRSWTGQAGTSVHGPADLSFDGMAGVLTRVLGRPIHYQEMAGSAYQAALVEHGQGAAFAQDMVDMFRAIGRGMHAADPRTPESTTPTSFEAWCAATLKPALA